MPSLSPSQRAGTFLGRERCSYPQRVAWGPEELAVSEPHRPLPQLLALIGNWRATRRDHDVAPHAGAGLLVPWSRSGTARRGCRLLQIGARITVAGGGNGRLGASVAARGRQACASNAEERWTGPPR